MLVILPFEEEIYRKAGVNVEYVGHPLADVVKCGLTKAASRKDLGLPARGPVVALLPGSRSAEVGRHLPVMLDAAASIEAGLKKKTAFIIPAARSVDPAAFDEARRASGINLTVVEGKMYEALKASDAAVVASGTATLETALMGVPMVIVYRMSGLSYGIGRALVDVPFIGLPNIIAGKKVATELIQSDVTAGNISGEILAILGDQAKRRAIIRDLKDLRARLGKGAAKKAAHVIASFLEG